MFPIEVTSKGKGTMQITRKFNVTRTDVVRYSNGDRGEYVNRNVRLSFDDLRRILESLGVTNFKHSNDELIIRLADVLAD